MRDAVDAQCHLDRGKRAKQHRLIQITQMADPKNLAAELAQAATERHVETIPHGFAERVAVVAVRHQDRRH